MNDDDAIWLEEKDVDTTDIPNINIQNENTVPDMPVINNIKEWVQNVTIYLRFETALNTDTCSRTFTPLLGGSGGGVAGGDHIPLDFSNWSNLRIPSAGYMMLVSLDTVKVARCSMRISSDAIHHSSIALLPRHEVFFGSEQVWKKETAGLEGTLQKKKETSRNYATNYFSSHTPVYEKDTKIVVWNCALYSASELGFDCCAHAHIGGGGEEALEEVTTHNSRGWISGPEVGETTWKELIDTFHHTVPTRRHWKHMKAYDNCFSGVEAITYFHKALQLANTLVVLSSTAGDRFPKNNSKSPNVLHLANHRYKKSNKDKLTKEYARKKRVGKENIDPLLMREATEYHDTKQSRYIQGHNNSELVMEKSQAWREPKPIPEMTKHLSEMPQETYEHKPIYTTEPVRNQELTSESSHMRQEKKIALGTSQASCEQKLIGKQGSFVHPYGIFPMMAGNNNDDLSDDELAGFVVKSCWRTPNLRISTVIIFLGKAQLEVSSEL
uniref:Uncharacterized protein n=1 Tax=Timema monikensis TaxID=170555 RepID=A0A7R9E436_9NEOP|nr:unnamed protein product [Timema monikensis]